MNVDKTMWDRWSRRGTKEMQGRTACFPEKKRCETRVTTNDETKFRVRATHMSDLTHTHR
eukprot:m.7353 g.7353  ORF g.7353 m.7353 type:complete len:60 (+) comp5088_c0_seq1:28-207(+)